MKNLLLILFVITLSHTPAVFAETTTITLQQGVDGYDGCIDMGVDNMSGKDYIKANDTTLNAWHNC